MRVTKATVATAVAVLVLATSPAAAAAADHTHPGGAPPASRFTTHIDNPWLPMLRGTVWRYRSVSSDGRGREVVRVTDRTKRIMGVHTVVVRDRAYVGGELVEDTFDWYAQDRRGNVWYFGENTKELENGQVVSTEGSWKAGRDGARPGIVMKAHPRIGETYYQEFLAGVAEDQATVLRRHATARVPLRTFHNALVTKDFSALEPGVVEHKFFVRGIGSVLEKLVRGGHERLALISVRRN